MESKYRETLQAIYELLLSVPWEDSILNDTVDDAIHMIIEALGEDLKDV